MTYEEDVTNIIVLRPSKIELAYKKEIFLLMIYFQIIIN